MVLSGVALLDNEVMSFLKEVDALERMVCALAVVHISDLLTLTCFLSPSFPTFFFLLLSVSFLS